jgi:hypothetical protein
MKLIMSPHQSEIHLTISNTLIMSSGIIYTITNWRVSLSKICHEWPNNAVTHESKICHEWPNNAVTHECEWVTTVFGHEWHIIDNETRQLVILFAI